ncbi:MAG TPA: DUF4233 domain-containing protein [Acidothermaceae bacterium]
MSAKVGGPTGGPPLPPSEYDGDDVARMYREAVKGKRRLTSSVLAMEVVVFWLAIIVAIVQEHVSVAAALAVGGALAVGCIVIAGMIRRPWAYVAGGVLQALAIACGIVVPVMFVIGGIFAVLWVVCIRLGDAALGRAKQFEAYVGRPPTPPPTSSKDKLPTSSQSKVP